MRTVWLMTEHGVPLRVYLHKPDMSKRDSGRYGIQKIQLAKDNIIFSYQAPFYGKRKK